MKYVKNFQIKTFDEEKKISKKNNTMKVNLTNMQRAKCDTPLTNPSNQKWSKFNISQLQFK